MDRAVKSMDSETVQRMLRRLDWAVKKQERFLNIVSRIQRLPEGERATALRDACWVDGTLAGQVQYCVRKRERLIKVYQKLYKRYITNS